MGDLRNKMAKELRRLQHKAWLLQNCPPSPIPPPPACWCGKNIYEAEITSFKDRWGETILFCPEHTPVFCSCGDLATRLEGMCERCWGKAQKR